jgi:hypothetical protein
LLKYQSDHKFGVPIAGTFYFITQQGRKPGWQGMLSNLIHYCDLICKMFGNIDQVTGYISHKNSDVVDSSSMSVAMHSENGAVVSLFFTTAGSWNAPIHEEWQLIDNQRNRIISRNCNELLFIKGNCGTEYTTNTNSIFWQTDVTGYQSQLMQFYNLCTGMELEASPNIHDALLAQKLYERIKAALTN